MNMTGGVGGWLGWTITTVAADIKKSHYSTRLGGDMRSAPGIPEAKPFE